MIAAIVSDIHGNREALSVVLGEISRLSVDVVYCLGDIVGYNADPDYCVQEVLSRCAATIRGNHDKAVAGFMSLEWFNRVAKEAALWTRSAMAPDTLERLKGLKAGPVEAGEGLLLCHGTPMDEDAYMWGSAAAQESFRYIAENNPAVRICFHGHTHVPMVAEIREGKIAFLSTDKEARLHPRGTYLINPGSVGQPRDGNPLASFGILDSGRSVYRTRRLRYAVEETQRKILAARLPRELAWRLAEGR